MDFSHLIRTFTNEGKNPDLHANKNLQMDPIEAAKLHIKAKLASDVAYRTSILTSVKTLASLEPEDMRIACETMEQQKYKKGDDIIRQGEKGDTLYLLQTGSVVITRKVNPRDENEEPTVLAKLPKNTHFGEIALLTEEPRSATVTALEDCICCLMKKKRFDEIVATSNAKQARHRYNVGKSVLSVVPTFSKFSPAYKDIVLEVMQPLHFPPGSYICKEGALASSFFIILDGTAKCTIRDVNGNPGDEVEVGRLEGSSYFGEVALLDPSNTRNCNVISIGDLSCMVLQRSDFATIYRSLKEEEGDKQKAMMKKKNAGAAGTTKTGGKRHVSAFAKGAKSSDEPHPDKVKTIVARMTRFITESTWITMYSKMYRSMVLDHSSLEDYGKIAWELMLPTFGPKPSRVEAITAITENCLKISRKAPRDREFVEQAFLCGMLRQPNKLKNGVCASWHPFQYTDLCKTSRIMTFNALEEIIDVGVHTTTMYLVLRGCVRTWRGTTRTDLVHEEDLVPGDVFGVETCISGNHTSNIAARAICNVHVACFEEADFVSSAKSSSNKISNGEKRAFLKSMNLFRRADDAVIAEIANILEQETIPKRSVLTRRGDVYPNLCFIYSGYAETVLFTKSPPYPSQGNEHVVVEEVEFTSIAKIEAGEIFGESGFIANAGDNSSLTKRDTLDYEHHDAVATTQMEILVLKPRHFHLIDKFTRPKIISASRNKISWRNDRLRVLKKENSQVKQVRKSMTSVHAAFEAGGALSSSVSRRRMAATNRHSFEDGMTTGNTTGIIKTSTIGLPLLNTGVSSGTARANISRSGTRTASNSNTTTTSGDENGDDPSNPFNFLGNIDLDDVPKILDGDFDPFMVIEAQKTQREVAKQTRNMRYLRLPKSSRGRGRSVETEKDLGFVATSLIDASTSRPSTGAGYSVAQDRYRSHISSRGRARTRDKDTNSRANYSETSQYTSFMGLSGEMDGMDGGDGGVGGDNAGMGVSDLGAGSLTRPNSSHALRGSALIPSSLSYIDSAEAHSRSNSPLHSRPSSRPQSRM